MKNQLFNQQTSHSSEMKTNCAKKTGSALAQSHEGYQSREKRPELFHFKKDFVDLKLAKIYPYGNYKA